MQPFNFLVDHLQTCDVSICWPSYLPQHLFHWYHPSNLYYDLTYILYFCYLYYFYSVGCYSMCCYYCYLYCCYYSLDLDLLLLVVMCLGQWPSLTCCLIFLTFFGSFLVLAWKVSLSQQSRIEASKELFLFGRTLIMASLPRLLYVPFVSNMTLPLLSRTSPSLFTHKHLTTLLGFGVTTHLLFFVVLCLSVDVFQNQFLFF